MTIQTRDHSARTDAPQLAAVPLSCEEFQAKLPQLIGTDIREHEHLKSCARCRALLQDLEDIASAAGALLLPVHEPRDTVWQKIHDSLREADGGGGNGHAPSTFGKG